MSDSACLLRSFSHPSSASREAKERDPLSALGDSISFGRFMSESLAWEKWSAFSQNRYLEEVEKFSKPGSVAQKKAYFEAHYKRKAAEKAAAELEEASTEVINEVKTEDQDSELLSVHNQVIETGEYQDFVQSTEFVAPADAHNSLNEEKMVEIGKVEEETIDKNDSVETSANTENANQNENAEDHITVVVSENQKTPDDASPAAEREIVAPGSLKRLRNYCSSRLLTDGRSSNPPSCPAKQATSIQQLIHKGNVTPKSKKIAGGIVERLATKSVHMSINFNAGPKVGKASPELPQIERKRMHMISLGVSKETSTPQKIANRASVNGLLKQPVMKPPSEHRRFLKSSTASGSKERSPLLCSPFRFRSEERAAKRKEFFQKLEEKTNIKEKGQKQQRERCQEKMENDTIIVRQSRSFKAKENQDPNQVSKSLSNNIKEVSTTKPQSSRLGKKPATSVVKETSSLPPRQPLVTSDNSNCIVRKKYRGMSQSVTSLGKISENSSLNIQS